MRDLIGSSTMARSARLPVIGPPMPAALYSAPARVIHAPTFSVSSRTPSRRPCSRTCPRMRRENVSARSAVWLAPITPARGCRVMNHAGKITLA